MGKLVRESVSFERGGDPRKTMKVGRLESLKKKYGEEYLNELLLASIRSGNLEDVKFLIEKGADIYSKGDYFFEAVENGHLDIIKYLIEEQGLDVDVNEFNEDVDEYTALTISAMNGHLDVVKYIIEENTNLLHDIIDNEYELALEFAAKEGHLDIVKYLVEHGVDVDFEGAPLKWAAKGGHLDVVKYLVGQEGADIEDYGDEAIELAENGGHEDVVKYLKSQM